MSNRFFASLRICWILSDNSNYLFRYNASQNRNKMNVSFLISPYSIYFHFFTKYFSINRFI